MEGVLWTAHKTRVNDRTQYAGREDPWEVGGVIRYDFRELKYFFLVSRPEIRKG